MSYIDTDLPSFHVLFRCDVSMSYIILDTDLRRSHVSLMYVHQYDERIVFLPSESRRVKSSSTPACCFMGEKLRATPFSKAFYGPPARERCHHKAGSLVYLTKCTCRRQTQVLSSTYGRSL